MAGSVKKRNANSPEKVSYTYADYLSWQDDGRYELIDGDVIDMTPAPGFAHQEICGAIYAELRSFLKGNACQVIIAPFDVVFSRKTRDSSKIDTVLQPDISVFCDLKKIQKNCAFAAPDLVVEVVSPSTASHDNVKKRHIYENAGVREYWLVYPTERYVRIYLLDDKGRFGKEDTYDDQASIQVGIFPGLTIDMKTIFPLEEKTKTATPKK